MSELDEVADAIALALRVLPISDDALRALVRQYMPDESPEVIDGVAWALRERQP